MSYQNPREIVKTSPVASGETRTFASNLTAERLASLQIASVWEIGSRTIRRIWEAHPDPREFLARGRTGWETFGLTQVQCNALATAIAHGARALAERLAREGIRFVLPGDAEYPPHLGRTADPPGALFPRGPELKDAVRVAVGHAQNVGLWKTRHGTHRGRTRPEQDHGRVWPRARGRRRGP